MLTSGTLLASCGPQQLAEKKADAKATDQTADAIKKADTARIGATPRLLATFSDSLNTPDGLALAPDGRVFCRFLTWPITSTRRASWS